RKSRPYLALRGAKIFSWGLIITAGSYLFMSDAFVFFGILHFIGISIILAAPFISFRYLNLALGAACLAFGIYIQKFVLSFPWLVWLGLRYPISTLDLYPILPWIGLVFLGMFTGNMIYPKGRRIFRIKRIYVSEQMSSPVRFLGRHAFLIYFLHLPVMFGIAYLISIII
ncbi:MAG: DUF1624 domain-containing protein, partial [Nanoarchaeota archaeon]|nr:DUF1624 domain-containing protein [Nanoarchaeota archaeon]